LVNSFGTSWVGSKTLVVLTQGLHPNVREARKSVARELICLQEKLDTLCKAPFGDLDHTNSNDDGESERTKSIIQTAAPTVTTEASDRVSVACINKVFQPYFAIVQ
jgi:hypothetical protein